MDVRDFNEEGPWRKIQMNHQEILKLLENGYENFELETAKKIIERYPTQNFFNKCPKCNELARTPYAKQCRFCSYSWHNAI